MKNIFCTYPGFKKTFFLGYIYIFQKLGNFQEPNYLTIKENK